jgi:glycosyltransferase involved in cell wall biosynthesis
MRHYGDWLSERGVECMHIPIGAYHEPEFLEETETPGILFFTTLAPFKGLEILLTAFDNLRAEYPQTNLTIAGVAHTRFPNYAHDLKSRFNGTHNIHWLGQVAEENVIDLFRRAQVVVLPYTASTGSSSVLYQAATWGRAVVVSDLSENQKLARENNLQLQFFESGNAKSLQNSLHTMLNSPLLRHTQARHNFDSIQRVRPTSTGQHYLEAFNRALEKHKIQK